MSIILSVGIAIFAMFFGAGNIIFTLALGSEVGNKVFSAFGGLFLTAVILPLIGIMASIFFGGDYKSFFYRTGFLFSIFLPMSCMLLLGPFGAIPRCIVTSYFAIKRYVPGISLLRFSVIVSFFIFITSYRYEVIMDIIGKFLGPIKLILLGSIVAFGLYGFSTTPPAIDAQDLEIFIQGCVAGYATMDLLGTFFFAGLIIDSIKKSTNKESVIQYISLKACIFSSLILAILYFGFCYIAAVYISKLDAAYGRYEFLNSLAPYILGERWGFVVNLSIAISCFITAIALIAIFSSYFQTMLNIKSFTYVYALGVTIVLSVLMSNLGFESIMETIYPIILVCYPVLIILSILSLVEKMLKVKFIKVPVFVTFFLSVWNINPYTFKEYLIRAYCYIL
ncbi:MAG: branched-chain amino acid transport system II carrier protein [Deltaproteobacteria bacterium]|nr:MAG: branched-chain amino acid transport system II carrier protein [Deltaproteobacteria bacterium]